MLGFFETPDIDKNHYKVNGHATKEDWLLRHPARIERLQSLLTSSIPRKNRKQILEEINAREAHLKELTGDS